MSREILRIFALALAAVAALPAQSIFGIIRGRVVDASGVAVRNVSVVVRNTAANIA